MKGLPLVQRPNGRTKPLAGQGEVRLLTIQTHTQEFLKGDAAGKSASAGFGGQYGTCIVNRLATDYTGFFRIGFESTRCWH